jgi:DNA repair ATPase RecN
VAEIAAMLAGSEASEMARSNAAEMLRAAENWKDENRSASNRR